MCGEGYKSTTVFLLKTGVDGIHEGLVSFGAWFASSNTGDAAWVLDTGEVEAPYQVVQCKASSATLMEIRAGLMVLQWASQQGMEKICIKTDCEVFVQGLLDRQRAPFDVQLALSDFCSLCSNFLVVKVVKGLKTSGYGCPIKKLRRLYRTCNVYFVYLYMQYIFGKKNS